MVCYLIKYKFNFQRELSFNAIATEKYIYLDFFKFLNDILPFEHSVNFVCRPFCPSCVFLSPLSDYFACLFNLFLLSVSSVCLSFYFLSLPYLFYFFSMPLYAFLSSNFFIYFTYLLNLLILLPISSVYIYFFRLICVVFFNLFCRSLLYVFAFL